jgi:hypothetical protein
MIKYCDCVVADETAFETMLCPAYTQIVGTYPKQENEIMLSTKTLAYLGISEPKVGMELKLDFYWNDLFQTKGTGQQTFQLSGYFTEYQNQGASSSIAFLSEKKLKESGAGWNPCRILLKPEKDSVSGIQMEQQLQEDIRLKEGQRIVSMDSAAYRAVEGMLGSYGFTAIWSDGSDWGTTASDYTSDVPADTGSCLKGKSCRRCHRQSGGTWNPALCH